MEYVQPANTMIPTRYYLLNGQPIALRIGSQPVTHLYRDQVGSVVMTSQNGVITDTRQYFAYGSKRGGDELPFEPNYTGQRKDDTGLLYYNARYYDPELGMFISPDSMIPNPMDYFSYNRYLYARGNPIRNNDPSGHNPIDSQWERDFEYGIAGGTIAPAHGRPPNDVDRRDRLFSMMFSGQGPLGEWTPDDWATYGGDKEGFWNGTSVWPGESVLGLERFASHVDRLSQAYLPNETGEFVKALAFIFGGVPLGNPIVASFDMASPGDNWAAHPLLNEGDMGWRTVLLDDHTPAHHYAGLFYTGYWFGSWSGIAINYARDGHFSDYSAPDIYLGDGAARQGWDLRLGNYSMYQLGDVLRGSVGSQPYLAPVYR